MGDVVKGAFGAPKEPKPEEKPEKRRGILREDLATLLRETVGRFSSMGIEMDDKLRAQLEAAKIMAHLNTLQGPMSLEAVVTAREIWRKKSMSELIEAAKASNRFEWSRYPGRFRALADELDHRSF